MPQNRRQGSGPVTRGAGWLPPRRSRRVTDARATSPATAGSAVDPRTLLDGAPMSPAQVVAVLITTALSALDSYDIFSVTFAAPGISRLWGLGKGALGVVLSSGLVGMALGALLVAPIADLIGRRRMIVANLALMAVGSLLSAFAHSIAMLAAWRVLTGIGIGAMIAIVVPLAAEYANYRHRALTIAVMSLGYPGGGVVSGLVATVLLQRFEWPAVFLFGAGLAAVMLLVVLVALPEPLAVLLDRRDARSLGRVNALLARFRMPPVESLPPPSARTASVPYRAIFLPGQRGVTVRITAVYMLFMVTGYFVLSWIPQMSVDGGLSPSAGSLVLTVLNGAAVVTCLIVGGVASRLRLAWLVAGMLGGLGLATAVFGHAPSDFLALAVMAAIVGVFFQGAIVGFYALAVRSFTPGTRATGMGFVTGMGRIASVAGPSGAGALFQLGAGRGVVCAALGSAAILGGILVALPVAAKRGHPSGD